MSNVDYDLTKLKLEISQGWRLLLRHKWRRPAWIRFPRSVMEDVRFIKLSERAKAAVPILLILASEDQNSQLPNAEIVFRSLRKVGISQRKDSFISLIHELIQSGFFLKTTPEYRVQSTDYREDKDKKEYTSAREASRGFASPTSILEDQKEKRLSEEERKVEGENPPPLAQPKYPLDGVGPRRLVPTSEVMEILGVVPRAEPTPATAPNRFTYEEAMARNSGPPVSRFEKIRVREGLR